MPVCQSQSNRFQREEFLILENMPSFQHLLTNWSFVCRRMCSHQYCPTMCYKCCNEKIEPENSCILEQTFRLRGTKKPWESWKHDYDGFVLKRNSVSCNMSMTDREKVQENLLNFDFLLSGSQIDPHVTSFGITIYVFFQTEGNS
jgi:beta-lactamase class D